MIVYVSAQYFCIHRQVVPSSSSSYPVHGERVVKTTGLAYYGKKKQFFCDVDPKCKTQNEDRMPYNNIQFLKLNSDCLRQRTNLELNEWKSQNSFG